MLIDFLQAADGTPLTKQYRQTQEGVEKVPYPFVRDFISHRVPVDTIEQFFTAIKEHAKRNHCLLKGELDQELNNESRAGHTNATQRTRWMLLDLDFDSGWSSIEEFLTELNPAWSNVSYIWQHSASSGITGSVGLRGHLWLLLEDDASPEALKSWLKDRNLKVDGLRAQLELTKTAMALKFPLDITTCQNDKLIYIAPPQLLGIDDPVSNRITLHKRGIDFAPVPKTTRDVGAIDNDVAVAINELRQAKGLNARKPRYKDYGDDVILANPDKATVTDVKTERGFVYLNLNGGDSWGYYFPEDKPEVLHNFKGEPPVRLADIAPEFAAEYRRTRRREKYGEYTPYVFRHAPADCYYNVLFDNTKQQIHMLAPVGSKERLNDFLKQYGGAPQDIIYDWTLVFDPTTTNVIDESKQWINRFRPSDYIVHGPKLSAYPEIPPTINKVLDSITDHDGEVKDHLINWLACLVQTRQRLDTGWIFHGIEGTGKGLLLDRILRPILGERHVTEWGTKEFEDGFNAPLEETCLLWLDEFRASASRNKDDAMSRLKKLCTESELTVRAMRTNPYQVKNFVNIIIATNFPDPIELSPNDRRWNIAPPQERRLRITEQEVDRIDEELWWFTSYLFHYKASIARTRFPIENDARVQMIQASRTSQESFFDAIRNGDMNYFLWFLQNDTPFENPMQYQRYEAQIRKLLEAWAEGKREVSIPRSDLMEMFAYTTGIPTTPTKFTRMCAMYRVPVGASRASRDARTTKNARFEFFTIDHNLAREYHEHLTQPKGQNPLKVINK